MATIAYSNFKMEGVEPVSNRLKRFVDNYAINKMAVARTKKLIALYYGSIFKYHERVTVEIRLDWYAANNYNIYVNGKEIIGLDNNDLYLINWLLDRGMSLSYSFTMSRYNLPKLFKKIAPEFAIYTKLDGSLGLRKLRNCRIWSFEHNHNLSREMIKQIMGYKVWIFPPADMPLKIPKPNFSKEI